MRNSTCYREAIRCSNPGIRNLTTTGILVFLLLTGTPNLQASIDISPWLPRFSGDSTKNTAYASSRRTGNSYVSKSPGKTFEVKFEGDITIAADDRSIQAISPGGYLKISLKSFGNSREVRIESDARGELTHTYYEGRNEVPFEPGGSRFLSEHLLEVARSSGIDADGRTKRIYGNRGLDGVIDEISEISSNSVQSRYFSVLLDHEDLSSGELARVAGEIGKQINSSSTAGRLFRDYSERFMKDNETARSYFEAIARISSSSEKGHVLRSLKTAIDFSDPAIVEAYFNTVDRISSSSERGRVLKSLLDSQEIQEIACSRMCQSIRKISSSSEKGSVLRAVNDFPFSNTENAEAYFHAVDGISSSSEKGRTLQYVLNNYDLDDQAMVRLLESAGSISSDSERGRVLRAAVPRLMETEPVLEGFFLAVDKIHSSSEKGRILKTLAKEDDLSRQAVTGILNSVKKVSSSSEQGSVLRATARHIPEDDESLKDLYMEAARSISSSSEYRRAVDALL